MGVTWLGDSLDISLFDVTGPVLMYMPPELAASSFLVLRYTTSLLSTNVR
jgi:hypothetical protein